MTSAQSNKLVPIFFLCSLGYLVLLPLITFPITTVLKPLPILCLLILNFLYANSSSSKIILSLAVVFSLLGDIALTFNNQGFLLLGMSCFILAHFAYISLFIRDFSFNRFRLVAFVLLMIPVISAYLYLKPAFGELASPIVIYLLALSSMVFTAMQVQQQHKKIITGACLFLLSDCLLGLNLFISHAIWLTILVMLTYYLAQFFLVTGLLNREIKEVNPRNQAVCC